MAQRVLVVDDEEDILWSLQEELSREGIEVLTATNGKEALKVLQKEPVDFLIADIRMPDMSGVDLLLKAKEKFPELKVIVMTAYGSEAIKEEVLTKGAIRYLEKPFDLEEVISLLKTEPKSKECVGTWDLTEVLQLISMEGKSAKLEVETPEGTGIICFHDGEIVHASFGKKKGEEAFFKLLKYSTSPLHLTWERTEVEKNIDKPLYALLLEAIAKEDEIRAEEALKNIDEIFQREPEMKEDIELEKEKREEVVSKEEPLREILGDYLQESDDILGVGVIDKKGKLLFSSTRRLSKEIETFSDPLAEIVIFANRVLEKISKSPIEEMMIFKSPFIFLIRLSKTLTVFSIIKEKTTKLGLLRLKLKSLLDRILSERK
jgi:CheY-like chemotaxis protein